MKKRNLRSLAQNAAKASGKDIEMNSDEVKTLEDMAGQFQGKNQQELLSELMKRAAEKKADGSLSAENLENFYNNASSMLTEEQRKNMRKLIDQIK